MIVEAKYKGPFFEVGIPGFENKKCKRGDGSVKIRLEPGQPIGGCWDITKGKKDYDAGLKAAEEAAKPAVVKPVAVAVKTKPDAKGGKG